MTAVRPDFETDDLGECNISCPFRGIFMDASNRVLFRTDIDELRAAVRKFALERQDSPSVAIGSPGHWCNDARLRDTLRVFLGCESSYKLAAGELTLHSNTVKYRVGRAMIRRGRPITNDRFDVELALLLCHWYGDALLSPKPS
jgi:hypothetical protein